MTTLTVADLRVRPGMDVEVRGQLALLHDDVVVTGYRMIPASQGDDAQLRWEQTPHVAVDDDTASAARSLVGCTVFGRGTWQGDHLTHGRFTDDDSWTTAVIPHDPYVKDLTPVSDHVRTVEAGLFSSGAMLRRVRFSDDVGPRVIVSATDVETTRRELEPVYGDGLEVHESRWSLSELRGLDSVLNDLPDDKVLKVEYRMDGDGVISRKLRVNYVDGQLVEVLEQFPPEMLTVQAVVEPAGLPQDRDPWFAPHPR